MENDSMPVVVPIVGLEKLYVAKILKDDINGTQFDIPKYLPGIKEIAIKPKVNTDPYYAENILWLNEETLENIEVEVNITDLATAEEAFILGHQLAKEGGIIYSENDKAPEVAILIKANKGNKKARYLVLYRGKFSISDEEYKSKEGKTDFQTKKLAAVFAPLKSNGRWKWKVDQEENMTDSKFFKEVIMPTPKTEEEEVTIELIEITFIDGVSNIKIQAKNNQSEQKTIAFNATFYDDQNNTVETIAVEETIAAGETKEITKQSNVDLQNLKVLFENITINN